MSATYVGNMMEDKNMTMWGDIWAREAIREFERFGTLSEVRTPGPSSPPVHQDSHWLKIGFLEHM